ncbi:hypothetical protein D921_02323 [Enterococcus faecalis F01966]|nr:hypothetical protein D921_02323 [Enterococcus faecalis F01966]
MRNLKMTKNEDLNKKMNKSDELYRYLHEDALGYLDRSLDDRSALTPEEQDCINEYLGLSDEEIAQIFFKFWDVIDKYFLYTDGVEKEIRDLAFAADKLASALFVRLGYFK